MRRLIFSHIDHPDCMDYGDYNAYHQLDYHGLDDKHHHCYNDNNRATYYQDAYEDGKCS